MADENPTGRECQDPPSPAGEDTRTESAVLALLLEEHPIHLTMDELILVLHADSSRGDPVDAGQRAVRELVGAGLVYRDGPFLYPSRAALYFDALGWLDGPSRIQRRASALLWREHVARATAGRSLAGRTRFPVVVAPNRDRAARARYSDTPHRHRDQARGCSPSSPGDLLKGMAWKPAKLAARGRFVTRGSGGG